mmetsp:Transcript_23392/g.54337  ORF Transcript_23392/g.54337 Transcript_23392/m.54337 type:complete len:80 (+) Transcript_23392:384-623(+)
MIAPLTMTAPIPRSIHMEGKESAGSSAKSFGYCMTKDRIRLCVATGATKKRRECFLHDCVIVCKANTDSSMKGLVLFVC